MGIGWASADKLFFLETTEKTAVPVHKNILRFILKWAIGAKMVMVASLVAFGQADAGEERSYTFAIVPQQSATVLATSWGPVIKQIASGSEIDLKFVTTKDIPTFEACLAKGTYDFAYMNPYHYVTFNAKSGYNAFAREKDISLTGLLVAHRSGNIRTLADLQQATIAFPSPAAFAATIIPRAELDRAGINYSASYVKSHDSVYLAVQNGLFPAGGGVRRTFENMPADVRDDLTIIFETEDYPAHAFAAHPSVSQRLIARIAAAMAALRDQEMLEPLGIKGFADAKDAEWDSIRALQIKQDQSGIATAETESCPSG
jgi:phosphonate transport system substrate-binding protein